MARSSMPAAPTIRPSRVRPPQIAADPDRRPLLRAEWFAEFFNTTTSPKGHGFNLVDRKARPAR